MKNIKLLVVALLAVFTVSSCMDNNEVGPTGPTYEQEMKRRDSTLNAQKDDLEAYAKANFTNPQEDTTYGIWYEVINTPEKTYDYVKSGQGWVPVVAQLKYKGELMDKTVFDDEQTTTQFLIVNPSSTTGGVIPAWLIAFYPQSDNKSSIQGLLKDGLQPGQKIRFITSSIWGYDNATGIDKIPANSPLVFTLDVSSVKSQY
ncbi:FKBP-type peptidyl-prolyl cis-trans isomerase [Sphingobacterium lactis]|uniref:FKBP-type peptidyl-prolyl cis-trans isomerase n=1 Tax=Sphingobacterium lactis TaxID=797291 RepID=UPI003EC8EA1D